MTKNDEKVFFHRYKFHQIFLLEMRNAVLTNMSKEFLLKSERFRSFYETFKFVFRKISPEMFFWTGTMEFRLTFPTSCASRLEHFWSTTKKITRIFSSANRSFAHTKFSSYNLLKKSGNVFAQWRKTIRKYFL